MCLRSECVRTTLVKQKDCAMRKMNFFRTVLTGTRWATIMVALGSIVVGQSISAGQEGKGGGKGGAQGGGGGRAQGGGGGAPRTQGQGGGSARVQSGGGESRPQAQGGAGARVQGGQPRGDAGGGAGVQGGATVPGGGATVRTPGGDANIRTPSADAGARLRGDAGANVRGSAPADARIGAGADARGRTQPGAAAAVDNVLNRGRDNAPNTVRVPRGRADTDPNARSDARIGIDGRADSRYSANWADRSRDLRGVRDNMANAFGGNRDRADFDGRNRGYDGRDRGRDNDGRGRDNDSRDRDWRDRDRADYWNRWGGNVRNSFRWGSTPYYTNQWWSGRNLIGLGLGNYSIGVGNNNWWGYQPWGNQYPYGYWWGRPRWNSFYTWFPNYGWNQPYYYDYGYGGNVVYRDNRVFVSGQNVGTAADYAASAADLAYIDPNRIEPTPADGWMPLGTFSVAISQDEQNPPRVIQLAVNQEGLISGTIHNRTSDKLYTVQGRVDKETQRVAFTIGDDPNVVLETGLYNLTLDETPVLVHFDESRTATYLFVRLEEPAAPHQAEGQLTPGVEALR